MEFFAGAGLAFVAMAAGFLVARSIYKVEDIARVAIETEDDPYLTEEELREKLAEIIMDEQDEYPCDPDEACDDDCEDCEGYWHQEKHDDYWAKIVDTLEFRRWALDAMSDIQELEEADGRS